MVVLSGEMFDAIEVNAARTGNHKRAAVRMSRLATQATLPVQASPSDMSRAEAHMRAGEQWLLADEPVAAADEFRAAIADAGPTFDDPRVSLARAMFALGRPGRGRRAARRAHAVRRPGRCRAPATWWPSCSPSRAT